MNVFFLYIILEEKVYVKEAQRCSAEESKTAPHNEENVHLNWYINCAHPKNLVQTNPQERA